MPYEKQSWDSIPFFPCPHLGPCGGQSQDRVSRPRRAIHSTPFGRKKKFFKEEGIQAEFVRIVPTVALAAMASGEIDYYTSIGSGVAGMLRGLPIKVVSCYVPSAPIALISRPEFKSVVDLRGRTIGINTYGSPIEVIGKLIDHAWHFRPSRMYGTTRYRRVEYS